jgi:hypothetical protein
MQEQAEVLLEVEAMDLLEVIYLGQEEVLLESRLMPEMEEEAVVLDPFSRMEEMEEKFFHLVHLAQVEVEVKLIKMEPTVVMV